VKEARMPTPFRDIETRLVHCGERAVEGAVCLPINFAQALAGH
jgi:hypothetical protein